MNEFNWFWSPNCCDVRSMPRVWLLSNNRVAEILQSVEYVSDGELETKLPIDSAANE